MKEKEEKQREQDINAEVGKGYFRGFCVGNEPERFQSFFAIRAGAILGDTEDYDFSYYGDEIELSTALTLAMCDDEVLRRILREAVQLYQDSFAEEECETPEGEDAPDFGIGEEETNG